MKKYLFSIFTLVLCLGLCFGAFAGVGNFVANAEGEEANAKETSSSLTGGLQEGVCISIVGEASKEVAPDKATISVSIESIDKDITVAKDSTFELFDKAVTGLIKLGVDKDTIIVDSYSSYPSYDYNNGRTLAGYYSILHFSYKLDNLSNIKESLDILAELGITSISNIRYEISNEQELYNETLLAALQNARDKASALLGRDDLTISNIKEESVYYASNLTKYYSEAAVSEDLVGKVVIKAKVKVKFC